MTRSVGRLVCWAIELSEFDISFRPRATIKGHTVANFIVDNTEEAPQEEEASELYTDDSSLNRERGQCVLCPYSIEGGTSHLRSNPDANPHE